METIIAIATSSIFSLVIAYLTSALKTKADLQQEKVKNELSIKQQQNYEYFLPFKCLADEFSRRLKHIINRLSEQGEKYENMVKRFRVTANFDNYKWYYNDDIGPNGGYFFVSTLYLNAMLFYWIRKIQDTYPYVPLKVSPKTMVELKKHNKISQRQNYISPIPIDCELYNFIKNIRALMSGECGIPFGLHDSFGDFMYDYSKKNRINYDEFCKILIDRDSCIKFDPMIKFWRRLINAQGKPDEAIMSKLKDLINLFEILIQAEIRLD